MHKSNNYSYTVFEIIKYFRGFWPRTKRSRQIKLMRMLDIK